LCGVSAICGVVGLDGRPWAAGDLGGVMSTLGPLGRDGGGSWAGTAGGCGVAVAAALRHATPEDTVDRQPAESADGSLVLVADLRLDNRDELAGALSLADAPTVPDSAFVLAAYERWGDDALDRLQGEFALALVDRRRGGVLLARDHVGSRPLVIHERRGVTAFASNALALTGLEGVGHTLDARRAAEVFGLVYVSERTFVEGVRAVPAATAVWISDAGARRWRWWRPDPTAIVDLGSAEAHERELRDALDGAVGPRLRSLRAVAAGTSGGLDSTSAAATAARLLAPDPLPTYTSAPPSGWDGPARPDWDADESPLVRKLADLHPNMAPRFVHLNPGGSLFDRHEAFWELGAGPVRNPCNFLWMHAILERARADGVGTLLSGARGNMAFSADGPGWLVSLLRSGRGRAAFREAVAWSRLPGNGAYRTVRNGLVYAAMPVGGRRIVHRLTGKDLPRLWAMSTALRPAVAAELDLPAMVPALRDPRGAEARELALWVVQAGASNADTQAAAAGLTGVEERDPTVDRRVLEVAMRQPEHVRRHDGTARAVVRGAMADRLPPEILHRTRRGEQLPDWLDLMTASRDEIRGELDQLTEHETSRALVDTDRLRRLVDNWPDRSARNQTNVIRDYRLALLRALVISRYLRWFERRARP
jgi:asparagine synthase (glutamine-hydrolysing)